MRGPMAARAGRVSQLPREGTAPCARVLLASRRVRGAHPDPLRPPCQHRHRDCHPHAESDTGAHAHGTAVGELTRNTRALPPVFAALDTPHALFHTHAALHACARSHRCARRARTGTHRAPVPTWPHSAAGTTCCRHPVMGRHSHTENSHLSVSTQTHRHADTQSPRVWNSLCT